MRHRLTAAVLIGLSAFDLACETGDHTEDEPGTVIVQDSAGIEIVESMTPAWDGDGWTVAATPTTVIEGDSYSIDAYDASGSLRRIIRLARGPRPITDDIRAAHETRLRERTSPDDEWFRRELSKPYPAHLPAFERLHADSEGNLWARQRRYGAEDGMAGAAVYEFFVFAADGRHLGTIELPANLEIYQIGADFILGRVRDELDIDSVHLRSRWLSAVHARSPPAAPPTPRSDSPAPRAPCT